MIEAVNSVLSNTSASRVATDQQSSLRSYAANPDRIQEVATAPYVSPHIRIDSQYNKAILQIRDSDTGDVLRQYPTEGQLKAYRTAQQFTERQKAREVSQQQIQPSTQGTSTANTQSVDVPSVSTEASSSAPKAASVSVPQAGSVEQEA